MDTDFWIHRQKVTDGIDSLLIDSDEGKVICDWSMKWWMEIDLWLIDEVIDGNWFVTDWCKTDRLTN